MARFVHLEQAVVTMAYDNGGVNRERPETEVREDFWAMVYRHDALGAMPRVEEWLATLTEEQRTSVLTGEEEEVASIMRATNAPEGTGDLLDLLFEEMA